MRTWIYLQEEFLARRFPSLENNVVQRTNETYFLVHWS